MFDVTDIEGPKWPNPTLNEKEMSDVRRHNLLTVIAWLVRWANALTTYSGKSEKSSLATEKKVQYVEENDEHAVSLVAETMKEIRSLLLDCVRENINTTHLLFGELQEVKAAIGSWRDDARINLTESEEESDDDRDVIAEYESLKKGREMIEGTLAAFGIDPAELPEDYREKKKERVNGKMVPVTPTQWVLRFPGKLNEPANGGETVKNGKTPTSMMFSWTLANADGETVIGKATYPYLARYCSTSDAIVGVSDLMTSIKARHGDNYGGLDTLGPIWTPRGTLSATKVKK